MLTSLSKSSIAANVILATLACTAVALRLVARHQRKLPLKADDYAIILALAIALGVCIAGVYAGATNLLTTPVQTMTIPEYSRLEKVLWTDVLLCHITYAAIKLSILLFYKRIFVTRWFQITANVFMGIVIAWLLAATFGHIFAMKPVDAWWNFGPDVTSLGSVAAINYQVKTVFDWQIFLVCIAAIDIGLDVFTLLLPVPVINGLQISKAKKRSLLLIFGLGFFCVVSSAVRLYYTWQLHLVEAGKINPDESTNIFTWNDTWAHIEACASIVTACLPTMAPLFAEGKSLDRLFRSIRSLSSRLSNTLLSSNKDRKGGDSQEASLKSLPSKHPWYKLEARSEARPLDTTFKTDEEALVENVVPTQVKRG